MTVPRKPENEDKRLEALRSYELLDTLPESAYDTITELASYICDTPISLVTLLDDDRNFLKSRLGVNMSESPRDISFCGHAILTEEPIFIIEDTRLDTRFEDNPLVKDFNAFFYAGVPLKDDDGYALGTLCVYDHKPRTLSTEQQYALKGLASQVKLLFQAHKRNLELEKSKLEIAQRNDRLEDFARLVAHDLKSPLANIEGLISLLKDEVSSNESTGLKLYLEHLDTSSKSMRSYIDGLLAYYRADSLLETNKDIPLSQIVKNISSKYYSTNIKIELGSDLNLESIPVYAVEQIISNLVDNGLKYNGSDTPIIRLNGRADLEFYTIEVSDNGYGIPDDKQNVIFDLFKTAEVTDRKGNHGTGMGLATVKKIVEALGGSITVSSTLGVGSIFTFTIRR